MFAAVLALPLTAGARNVSVEEARTAGAYYMECNTMHDGIKAADLTLIHQFDNEELGVASSYVFNVSDWGWIIMSASTAVSPVIGWYDDGNLPAWDKLSGGMRAFVEEYSNGIGGVQVLDATGKFDDMDEWTALFNHTLGTSAKDGSPRVILMNEHWEQGENRNPTYNKRCPYDTTGTGKYCYVGCVATAMSQIMHYYAFPKAAEGNRVVYTTRSGYLIKIRMDTLRFDYTQMPIRLTSASSTAQIDEVARLCFAAGVSVRMEYGIDGSGAHSESVPLSMNSVFKYETGVLTARDRTTTDNFLSMLRYDLVRRRPVYMSGVSSTGNGRDAAGHAWVCCGYRTDNEDQYYMNWGWNGGDGFFNLRTNSMAPSGYGYNFNLSQDIITGMVPRYTDSTDIDFMTGIESVESNVMLGTAYPNPAIQTVSLPYSTTVQAEMQIFSIDGKLVGTRRLMPGSGNVELNVADMPAGIYIYRLGERSGKFLVQ